MLLAHLSWATNRIGSIDRLTPHADPESLSFLNRSLLATDWIPFRCLIRIDRAIAAAVGGTPLEVFRSLGRHSASLNLSGVYKAFISDEPHRFFDRMGVLHNQFQNFGRWRYEKVDDRAGRISLDGYTEYSPVYCASAGGYFEEALRMMKAPGPIVVAETSCQCAGEATCLYEMTW